MKVILQRSANLGAVALALLVATQFFVVISRYLFGINALWGQELAVYLHALVLLIVAPFVFVSNKHVTIDVLSSGWKARWRRSVQVFGLMLLLLPMMAAILITSVPYVLESWRILEGSPEVSGLPALYLVKSLIPVFATLMVIAALTRLALKK